MKCVTHERLKDSKGRQLTRVMADAISDRAEKEIKAAANRHQDELLEMLDREGRGASIEELAKLLGWLTKDNKPYKSMVFRVATTLRDLGLVKKNRHGNLVLTEKGQSEIKQKEN